MCAAPLPSTPTLPSVTLLEAAADVLAAAGPRAVSAEQIAEKAGVSVATIKAVWPEELDATRAAIDYLGELIFGTLGPERPNEKLGDLIARVLAATEHNRRYWLILTWCLLEGHHTLDLKQDFPVLARMVRAAGRSPGHSASPEAIVAGIAGAGMGLLLYGPYLQVALGQGEARWQRTRGEIVTLVRRLMLRAERRSVH